MRKLLISLSFLFVASTVYSQETTPSPTLTKQDYLKKSKSQKTTAWILLGAGVTLLAIAAPGNVSFDVLPILAIGSGAAIIGSIPLFIAAGKNKRRAAAMTANFEIQRSPVISYAGPSSRLLPGISVKVNF